MECKYRLGLTTAAGTGLQQACGGAAFLSFYTLQMSLLGGRKEETIKAVLSVAVVVRVKVSWVVLKMTPWRPSDGTRDLTHM